MPAWTREPARRWSRQNLLERARAQGLAVGDEAGHRVGDFVVAVAVGGGRVAEGLVVLDLDAQEAAGSGRRSVRDEDVEGGAVAREVEVAPPRGVLEKCAGDSVDALGSQASEEPGGEVRVACRLAEQVEAQGLAREEVAEEAVLLDELAGRAAGAEHGVANDVANAVGQEVREGLAGEGGLDARAEGLAPVQPDGVIAPFAPEGLQQARLALEGVVRAYEDVVLGEDVFPYRGCHLCVSCRSGRGDGRRTDREGRPDRGEPAGRSGDRACASPAMEASIRYPLALCPVTSQCPPAWMRAACPVRLDRSSIRGHSLVEYGILPAGAVLVVRARAATCTAAASNVRSRIARRATRFRGGAPAPRHRG